LGFPAKILRFHPVPFSSNHVCVLQRERSREHVGESIDFFPYLNNNYVLPSIPRGQCQCFVCPLLEKYSRNSLLSLLLRRARSSWYQQKEDRTPLSLLPAASKNPIPLPLLVNWKKCKVPESLTLVAFWCPAWLLATGADGHRFPVVACHICHFCADVLGTPRHPKWHQTPTFRQVKRAAGKCPPWQSMTTDALRERSKAIWAGGLMRPLPGLLLLVWRKAGNKDLMGRCAGEEGRDRCDNQVPRGNCVA